MSRHSILFFNNFSKFHGNAHDGTLHHTDSHDHDDFSLSSEASISQSLDHDLFYMEKSAHGHTQDQLGKSQASPQVLKFMNYMKDLENNPNADPHNNHIILTSHATQGNRGIHQRVHSLENFEKIGNRNRQNKLNESLLSSTDEGRKKKPSQKSLFERRRNKQVPLTSQFRRKSCHCSDCGGISKYELKVQDVVQGYNKQLKMIQTLRDKLKEKSPKAKSSPHLKLPDLQKMLIQDSKSGGNKQQKKGNKSKTHNILKVETGASSGSVHFGGRDFHQAGSETPLKQTKRSSIEGTVLAISNGLYHIRIITAPEVENEEHPHSEVRREGKESIKKEHGLLRPLGLTLKKKKALKKSKATNNQNLPQTPRSALRQSIIVDDVVLLSRSPIKDPIIAFPTSPPQESERKKSRVFIKRCSSKYSNTTDSPIQSSSSKISNDLNTPIQKEMWRPVSMCSPKFKSTFAPKIEEEAAEHASHEHNNNLHKHSNSSVRLSPKAVQKVYKSSPITIPSLKISPRKEFPAIKPVSSARGAATKSTLADSNSTAFDDPKKLYYFNLSSLTERKAVPGKDDSKSKDHSISTKQSYDFTQSPYAFSLSAQRRLKGSVGNIDSAPRPKTSSLEKILEKTNKLSLKKVFSDKPPSIKSSLVAIHSPKESQVHPSNFGNNNGKIKDSPVSSISSSREFQPSILTHNTPSRRFMFA